MPAFLRLGAQELHGWEPYLNQVMTAEDAATENWQQTYDLLCDLTQHPININKATREELEALPFLSAQQVEELMAYLYRYAPMRSTAELRMLKLLTPAQRTLLSYCIYAGEGDTKRYVHHDLTATAKLPLSEGHWLRYQLQYGDRLKAGLVADQDADEPFLKAPNRWGYDYYAPYLQLNRYHRLETLVLGSYRVSMGMGLVMNNSFALGKIAMLQNLGRSTNTLRAHSSRTENALQGAGATLNLGRGWHVTAFAGYVPMDATLNKDGSARTILTTGYHRTTAELSKKHNLHATKVGGTLRYQAHGWHWGLNGLYTHLDRELRPDTKQLYNLYKPQGTNFVNMSMDYGYANRRWALNGETAVDGHGHVATINSVSLAMDGGLTLMALQRFYQYRYTGLDAQSYSDGGCVQNESGAYIGANWQLSPKWQVAAYVDWAYFPWVRYRHPAGTWTMDYLLQGLYTGNHWKLSARYRLKAKEHAHRTRLSAECNTPIGLSLRTQLDGYYGAADGTTLGGMLSESVAYAYKWLRLNAGAGYYHTDDYSSRLYVYENGPLYTYAMQQLYGEGLRYWLMARVQAGRKMLLTAKMGGSNYFDKPAKTDVMVQLRLKI